MTTTAIFARRYGVRLLPRAALLRTGPVDHADWNFRPLLGWLSLRRVKLANRLLPPKVDRLLEIGYGSGVFTPEWATRAAAMSGLDPHPMANEVTDVLDAHGVRASLASGSAEAMPYPDAHFDCVLAISAVEFIPDLAAACREVTRVLRPGGSFVVVTPGRSPLVDFGLKLLTGQSAKTDYADRREAVEPTLYEHFSVQATRTFPTVLSSLVCLYTAMRLVPRATGSATA